MNETRIEARKSQMERIAHRQRNRDRHEPGAFEICKTDVLWTLLYFILRSPFLSNQSSRFGLFVFNFYLLLVVLRLPCCTQAFSSCDVWVSVVVVHEFSCSLVCAVFADQGLKLLAGRFLTSGPSEKSKLLYFKLFFQ